MSEAKWLRDWGEMGIAATQDCGAHKFAAQEAHGQCVDPLSGVCKIAGLFESWM